MLSKSEKTPAKNTITLIVVIILLALLNTTNWLISADNYWFDWLTREYAAAHQPDPQIVIIEIDDRSLTSLEQTAGRWPWSRSIYGYLLEGLSQVEPKAVVFDILFSERDQYRPDDDVYFAETVKYLHQQKEIPVFFSASLLSEDAPITAQLMESLPDSLFLPPNKNGETAASNADSSNAVKVNIPWGMRTENWLAGLINFDADTDGVSRYYQTYHEAGNQLLYSLPLKVVTGLFQPDRDYPKIFRLQFKGEGLVPFQSISFSDALQLLENPKKAKSLFANKILLIGATATGLHDLRPSPIAELYPATSILATAIDNLKNGEYWSDSSTLLRFLVTLIPLLILLWFLRKRRLYLAELWMGSVLLAAIMLTHFLLSYLSAMKGGLLLPVMSPMIVATLFFVGMMFMRGIEEYFSRQHALQTFSRFMDPIVVNQLLSDEQWTKKIEPQSREVSILFSDIRGFTTLSEKRSAQQVMKLLNQYFDKQVETIFEHKGTLDKFIGDAIMAFWGAPLDDKNHAEHAVTAALKMVDNLIEFRQTLPEELQKFDVGIGVHSGEAVVGMLGSRKRFDYTAIGDSVNLASRIEGVTKGVARVLISEATMNLCPDTFHFEYRGEFQVKGRQEPVRLYEPTIKPKPNENAHANNKRGSRKTRSS